MDELFGGSWPSRQAGELHEPFLDIRVPAAPFSWDALAVGMTLVVGIVLPLAYPPVRRGIRNSPLLKVGASALLETGLRK